MAQTEFQPLPLIMVAPNGARRTKADHEALPMTVAETVSTARACYEAGAKGLHAHVRDGAGNHVLDAEQYRNLQHDMKACAPEMLVQITTEAAGRHSPGVQQDLVRKLKPASVSIALREMIPDVDTQSVSGFYAWARTENIAIQHILYSDDDLIRFFDLVEQGVIPGEDHQLLFVLGRYADNQESAPEDLDPFLKVLAERRGSCSLDWAICAFGHRETECLVSAVERGGKARIGFENGLWNRDGALARDNADRVQDLVSALKEKNLYPA